MHTHKLRWLVELVSNVGILATFPEVGKGVGQNGTCPPPWKGKTGICDRMADSCSIDAMCQGTDKCCFSGCQRMCVKPIEYSQGVKPGTCPKPWKGIDGICDRRGDTCDTDQSCRGNKKCCFNGCQKECVQSGEKLV